MAAGAEGYTHLGNGCPPQWHRHDNIVFRVLDEPGLRVSLIPDGIHVSTSLFRLFETPAAGAAQEKLATRHVWSRTFPWSPHLVRLGIPAGEHQWQPLQDARRTPD